MTKEELKTKIESLNKHLPKWLRLQCEIGFDYVSNSTIYDAYFEYCNTAGVWCILHVLGFLYSEEAVLLEAENWLKENSKYYER